MAKKKSPSKETESERSGVSILEKLSWTDLEQWAGSRTLERGKSYQKQGRVVDLCRSEEGTLLAWVTGNERYATRVETHKSRSSRHKDFFSRCSCPVGVSCKHAVAVILEYLEMIEEDLDVEIAQEDDLRWEYIETGDLDDEFDDDEFDEDDDWESSFSEESDSSLRNLKNSWRKKNRVADAEVRSYLESKSQDELVNLLLGQCGCDGELRKTLLDQAALASGEFKKLLKSALVEMRSLTSEEVWRSSWSDEDSLPDYSGLEQRLLALLNHGCADELVTLGQEFLRRGVQQIESSHDEGETGVAIGQCFIVIRDALLQSSFSDEEKILYAIDVAQADEWGFFDEFGAIFDEPWEPSVWSEVADLLLERLDEFPQSVDRESDWRGSYRREKHVGWVIQALDESGRSAEATSLCVEEAQQYGSYLRAVRRLIHTEDFERAEQLAFEGLEQTSPKYRGIIHDLQDCLCELSARKKEWLFPAAIHADRFFKSPDVESYNTMLKAARKAKCLRAVKRAALEFLETGVRPDVGGSRTAKSKRKKNSATWPLPEVPGPVDDDSVSDGSISRRRRRTGSKSPHYRVLIELAIDQERPDEVLLWYDRHAEFVSERDPSCNTRYLDSYGLEVAEAVEKTHPDRAAELYRELAENLADMTNTSTYPDVAKYLSRVEMLLRGVGKEQVWELFIERFREKHKRKRRLMEILDRSDDRPILQVARKK